jgi:hypothetical protein
MRKVFEVLRPKSHCESVRPVVTLRPAMTRLTCLALALAAASVVLAAPKSASAASVKWRVQLPGQYILQRPVAGPDGSIAVVTSTGAVYSLAPNGAVRWVVPGVAGDSAPSFAPDGTVYVGSMNRITAISPKGVIRWTFTEPSSGQGVIAGPNVGPDGNIYVVSDFGGLGAYALSPSGQLLWSNPGDPSFIEYGQVGAEIVFGSGRFYTGFDEFGVAAQSKLYGLTLGGQQQWAVSLGGSDDIFMQRQRQPATGADGSLYMTAMGGANGWSLFRVDPASGAVLWGFSPYPANGMSPPTVGPNGSVYFSRSLGYLQSVSASGQSRWTFFDGSIIDLPAVTPNGAQVVAGDRPNFGEPGTLRGWNAATGAPAWRINLPLPGGAFQIVYTRPSFSADSSTAYVGTATFNYGDTSYVYAVDTSSAPTLQPPPRKLGGRR